MQFLKQSEIPTDNITQTFKNASWRSILWVVLITAVITAYTAIPKGAPTNPVLIAVPGFGTLFFSGLFLWHLWRNRDHRNWLVKASEKGLYVNLQSSLEIPPMPDVPAVIFLPREDIQNLRRIHELRILPDRQGKYKNNYLYFDITLRTPLPEALLIALAQIRRNPALRGSAGLRRDLRGNVRVHDQYTLRLVWDWMTPRELAAEAWFAKHYTVEAREKFTSPGWENLSPEEKDAYIDTLWEWGAVQDAILQKSIKDTISERSAARELAQRLG